MKIALTKTLLGVVASTLMLVGLAQAQAPEVLNTPISSTVKKKAKKSKTVKGEKSSKAKFVAGAQETQKERSARLMRECRGAVDAGACTGYTR